MKAKLKIIYGNGKPIPLDEATNEEIVEAIKQLSNELAKRKL